MKKRLTSVISEFKEFAVKGNVVDMAVGVIVGTAFGKISTSLVNDIIMPPIGVLLGGVNFTDLTITLKQAVGTSPAVMINYGSFLQTVINFLITALVMFAVVKVMNAVKRAEQEATTQSHTGLLTEIRDLLKDQKGDNEEK